LYDKIFFVVKGRIQVSKEDVKIAETGEGESFGEIEVLDMLPAEASIKTLEPTKALSLSNKSFRTICKADITTFAAILLNLSRELCGRLRHMDVKAATEWISWIVDEDVEEI
jgi:CRP-like cAMP-binding protein